MGKSFKKKKSFGKLCRVAKFSKIFKFRRHSCKKIKSRSSERQTNISNSSEIDKFSLSFNTNQSEYDSCMTLSTINCTNKFLQNFLNPEEKNGQFIQNFYSILKQLNFKKNELVVWTLLLEEYKKINNNQKDIFDKETLFYIGLLAKEFLGKDICQNYKQKMITEKMVKIKSILERIEISNTMLNKTYNNYWIYSNKEKNTCYDINKMVKFIYDSNPNIVKKCQTINNNDKNKSKKNKVVSNNGEIPQNNNNYKNYNEPFKFFAKLIEIGNNLDNNDYEQDDEYFNKELEGINNHDFDRLPSENIVYDKLDSFENIKVNENFIPSILKINQK